MTGYATCRSRCVRRQRCDTTVRSSGRPLLPITSTSVCSSWDTLAPSAIRVQRSPLATLEVSEFSHRERTPTVFYGDFDGRTHLRSTRGWIENVTGLTGSFNDRVSEDGLFVRLRSKQSNRTVTIDTPCVSDDKFFTVFTRGPIDGGPALGASDRSLSNRNFEVTSPCRNTTVVTNLNTGEVRGYELLESVPVHISDDGRFLYFYDGGSNQFEVADLATLQTHSGCVGTASLVLPGIGEAFLKRRRASGPRFGGSSLFFCRQCAVRNFLTFLTK